MNEEGMSDRYINSAEDKQTSMAKGRVRKSWHSDKSSVQPTILEKAWGLGSTVATAACRLFKKIKEGGRQRPQFVSSVDM